MAFAGQHKILVAVQPDLARPIGVIGRQRCQRRPLGGLTFLAAEAAAHTADLAHHLRLAQPQHTRNRVLHLARMLGGTVHMHLAALERHGHGNLSFEIEMLLPANPLPAAQPLFGQSQRGRGIGDTEGVIGQDGAVFGQSLIDSHNGRVLLDLDDRQPRGAACQIAGLGNHQKQRLAEKKHGLGGQ